MAAERCVLCPRPHHAGRVCLVASIFHFRSFPAYPRSAEWLPLILLCSGLCWRLSSKPGQCPAVPVPFPGLPPGCICLSSWWYDDHSCWHLFNWPQAVDDRVMCAMYHAEQYKGGPIPTRGRIFRCRPGISVIPPKQAHRIARNVPPPPRFPPIFHFRT